MPALVRQRSRCFVVARIGRVRRGLERGQALGARVDEGEVGGITAGERIEPLDRHVELSRRRAQREQALLDSFELTGIVLGGGERRIEMPARLIERDERGIERPHRRLDQPRCLASTALQTTYGGR